MSQFEIWKKSIGSPDGRIEQDSRSLNQFSSPDEFSEYIQNLVNQNISFQNYIGIYDLLQTKDRSNKSNKISQHQSIKWDDSLQKIMQYNEIDNSWSLFASELAKRIISILGTSRERCTDSKTLSNPPFQCSSCWCTLFKYDYQIPRSKQHLQTFSLIWHNTQQRSRHTNLLDMVLCRACYLLWQVSGQDKRIFHAAQQSYFRRNGNILLYPYQQKSYLRPIQENCTNSSNNSMNDEITSSKSPDFLHGKKKQPIFYPKYHPSIMNKSHVYYNQNSISLSLLKSCWTLQNGLVTYPVEEQVAKEPDNLNEFLRLHWNDLEDTYHWIQCNRINEKNYNNIDNDRNGSINNMNDNTNYPTVKCDLKSEGDSLVTNRVSCTFTELQKIDILERIKWINYHWKNQNKYQIFWIPIDITPGCPVFSSLALVPRISTQPLSVNNFIITTKYLALLEEKFSRSSIIDWLFKVCYHNTVSVQSNNLTFQEFASIRFDIAENDSTNEIPESVIHKEDKQMPRTWTDIGRICNINESQMKDFFTIIQEIRQINDDCQNLEEKIEQRLKQYHEKQEELRLFQNTLNLQNEQLYKSLEKYSSDLKIKDLLHHIGIKFQDSKHKSTPSKFDLLTNTEKLRVLKFIFKPIWYLGSIKRARN